MKAAAIQMHCTEADKDKNLYKAERFLTEACEMGAELIVLPELFNTGYTCNAFDWQLSELPDGETYQVLKKYADSYHCVITGGFVEKSNVAGLVYNSVMLVSHEQNEPIVYRKNYLWGEEKNRFLAGSMLPIVKTGKGTIGMQICYEAGFPENARILALGGAELLCYSAAFGEARKYAWEIGTRARAVENGCFLIGANHCGTEADVVFCNRSRIINPQGELLAEAKNTEDVILADFDLNEVYRQRNNIPYLRDLKLEFSEEQYKAMRR